MLNKIVQGFIFLIPFFVFQEIKAQQVEVGGWKTYISFSRLEFITADENNVYSASKNGIQIYNSKTEELSQLTKQDGLSGVNISSLHYIESIELLAVGYSSGLIDFIDFSNSRIITIPDIMNSQLTGSKQINAFKELGDNVLVATDFGIVLLSPKSQLVFDTYILGNEGSVLIISDVEVYEDTLYAATVKGLLRAPVNHNSLADYKSWQAIPDNKLNSNSISLLEIWEDKLLVVEKDPGGDKVWVKNSEINFEEFYNGAPKVKALVPKGNKLLVCNEWDGHLLLEDGTVKQYFTGFGEESTIFYGAVADSNNYYFASENNSLLRYSDEGSAEQVKINSPYYSHIWKLRYANNNLYVSPGAVDGTFDNSYNKAVFSVFNNETWENYGFYNQTAMKNTFDVVDVIPRKNGEEVLAGCFGAGMFSLKNDSISLLNENNSPLEERPLNDGYVAVSAFDTDSAGNTWVANSMAENLLKVLTPEDTWYSFNLGNLSTPQGISYIDELKVTSIGQKWIVRARGHGLIVFDENNTLEDVSDDKVITLNTNIDEGGLPTGQVYSVTEDLDGAIWVGTESGPAIFYNPEGIFDGEINAEQILIEQDGNTQVLLETERINDIEVDGGNRKWMATERSGVFLYSPDGSELIQHFTKENSPLLSNRIIDIALNPNTGDVYFGMEEGIQSLRGNATSSKLEISELKVYPNPVRLSQNTELVIDELAFNTTVKITNATGVLINEITSEGGRAIWNLKNDNGRVVLPGVYYFFAATRGAETSGQGKVLILKE